MSLTRTHPEREPEARVIGTLRAVTSAQAAYAALCGSYASSLGELAAPSCESYPLTSPNLLVSDVAFRRQRFGYRFELVPGRPPARQYAYIAVPAAGGQAAFCTDVSTMIYETRRGTPLVREGRCVDRSRPWGAPDGTVADR